MKPTFKTKGDADVLMNLAAARAFVEVVNKLKYRPLDKALDSIAQIPRMLSREWFLERAMVEGVLALSERIAANGGYILMPFRLEVAEGQFSRSYEADVALLPPAQRRKQKAKDREITLARLADAKKRTA